ncbi:protein C1orf43 homolog [Lepeophtheirus salmonis]|uniref:protein C1orf43 homolog n=1 Tax=Lepeophtheirus salmonis TaxID=72036 RepID=UPI003AF3DDCC
MPVEQLSGVTVVIIIAVCVEAFIVLLIFARRQIMRFGLRNRRGPHTHIGLGAPKTLRREVDRKLDYIPYVKHEPPLKISDEEQPPGHIYRIKALESHRLFEKDLFRHYPSFARIAGSNIRSFLNNCLSGPLSGVDSRLIHQICDDYSDARYHYQEFGSERYEKFSLRLDVLRKKVIRNPSCTKKVRSGGNGSQNVYLNISSNKLNIDSSNEDPLALKQIGSSAVLFVGSETCSSSTAV